MHELKKIKPLYKIALLILVLFAVVIALPGCSATRGAIARGWAGGVVEDGVIYTASMEGTLVSVNTTDGRLILSIPLETQEPATGFLSCAQGSSAVAIYSSPMIADDLVCVGGYNGKIYAFGRNEIRQEPRWVYPRQDNVGGSIIGGIIYHQGKLYFGSANNKVFALDAADGYKEWEIELPDKIWSTPVIMNDTLYIGSFDKKLYALDTADGSIKWEYETEGAIVSTPIADGNTVYYSSFDRNLYALNAMTGSLKWKYLADNWFWADPVITNGTIYAPCLDGKIYVIDASSGEKIADYELESPVSSSPVLIDDVLVVATQDGMIYGIDTTGTGYEKLAILEETIFAPLIAGDGKVYVHTNLDTLHEVDAMTGAKREIYMK
jgi:outer membrane protein assembly factor BamB